MPAPRSNACALILAGAFLVCTGLGQADEPISVAENLLFLTNHLDGLKAGTVLNYGYAKSGTLEPARQDEVRVSLTRSATGSTPGVHVEYLTGEQRFELPDVGAAAGNPVILFFLEHDVRQMQRLTGGQAAYFRKRVRLALAENAEVTDVSFDFGGRSVAGKQIFIQPYRTDPLRSRFEKLADKTYVFTLSDGVPGGVYRMQTTARSPKARDDAPALIEESVTLLQVEP